MKKWFKSLVFLFLTINIMVLPSLAADEPAMVVGRVFRIEGDLLRYVPEESDWVAVVEDAPFGTGDTLYSGSGGMAELAVPNGSWIRIGNGTQLQFIDLEADLAETDVASGIARFYNKGSRTVIKATSPYGYVLADPGTAFDFYVGENSVEVVAVKGEVSFVHSATNARYDVAAGSPSILADQNQVSSGEGTFDPEWEQWNNLRENFWAEKSRVRGRSVEYLPPDLRDDSYTLEENGRWESVPYEGSPRWFWRPTTVTVGWSPFTMGRWTDWDGDQTWIPAEPFGYVTHHYGNWVYVRNNWYWAPPVASERIGLPLLNVGFFWNPGRVSWIYSGAYVGWVPLAPRETYYSRRNWGGPHGRVVNNINITRININVRSYDNARHAIIVNQNNFYGANNYRNVRVTNINNTTIINNYRAAPVVNNTVVNNYGTNRQRYNYTNTTVNQKPHNSVVKRIRQNETIIEKDKGRRENAAVLKQEVKRTPEGRIKRESQVAQPRITNRIVPATEVNRPESEVRFQQKEIKRRGEGAKETRPGQIVIPQRQPVRPEKAAPERAKPPQPVMRDKPGKTKEPEQVAPQRPGQTEKPGQIDRPETQPVRPEQAIPERVNPPQPVTQERPGKTREPEQVAPQRPRQTETPDKIDRQKTQPPRPEQAAPERAKPPQPVMQEKPGKTREPERVAPQSPRQVERPDQIDRPMTQPARPEQAAPERAKPPQPVMREKPGKTSEPEQVAPQRPRQAETPDKIDRQKTKPARPEQAVPEHVKPPRQAPDVAPEKVKPANPDKREKSREELEKEETPR
jgi:hypothetical protein